MPPGPSWVLPLYELALLAATVLEKAGDDKTRLTVVTPEDAPLEIFGGRAVQQTAALLSDRRIDVVAGAAPIAFEAGGLSTDRGESVEADAVITLPRLEGRRIGGVPHDEGGFVAVDEHSGVLGMERIYAAGDVSSLPFKQGAFSTEQADCAAEAIAAAAGSGIEPRSSGPTMRAVLWTGQGPRYLAGIREDAGISGPSERHLELLHNGRVSARYLTPLVDSLLAGADFHAGGGALAEVPQRG
jgi:sulfide:quinone oxidoreductase